MLPATCVQLEPQHRDVRALQARYRKESAAANQRDAKMFKAMFAGLAKQPDRQPALPKVAAAAAAPVSDSALCLTCTLARRWPGVAPC